MKLAAVPLALRVPCPWIDVEPPPPAPPAVLDSHDYSLFCAGGCGTIHVTKGRPVALAVGWPKLFCHTCGKDRRTGRARCTLCGLTVMACKCSPPYNKEAAALSVMDLLRR
eukprot:10950721-Alexandrium_andersonii.AAC.1